MSLCKRTYRSMECQVVPAAIQDSGRNCPADRVLTYITQVLPGQIFAERSGDHSFLFQFLLRYIGPGHPVKDQLLHIYDRGYEECAANHRIDPGIHAEKRTDTVGDQGDAFISVLQLCHCI